MLSVLSIGLAFVPLFNLVGFEFAVTAAAFVTWVSGWRACSQAAQTRQRSAHSPAADRGFPGKALGLALAENFLAGLLPLAIIAANSLRVPTCNWGQGLLFYALFCAPGICYGTTLGFGLGLITTTRRARLLFLAWSVATVFVALWHVVRQPPIFAYNAFIAFFPGPLYDRFVPVTTQLLLARSIVLLESLLFVLLAVATWDGYRLRPRALFFPWTGARALAIPLAVLFLLLFLGFESNAARLGLRPTRRSIQESLGGHIVTQHCDIHYDTRTYSSARAQELAEEHEFHYSELRKFFGFDLPRRIGSYVYASPEQKKRLMGAGGTSFEDALNDEFHINAASWPHPVLRHEMAHIFAAHMHRWWRVNPWIGLHEGIAVAAEWRQESGRLGLTPDEACAAMDSLGLLPDMRGLLGAVGFWTQPGSRAYTAAGSFVRFLLDLGGMENFRRLWATRDFRRAYGRPMEELVQTWKLERLHPIDLSAVQMERAERLYRPPAIFAIPCAREQARLQVELVQAQRNQQPGAADSLYARLVELQPDDPGLRLGWARQRLAAGDDAGALSLLHSLSGNEDLGRSWHGQVLAVEAEALWGLGRFEAADSCLTRAMPLAVTRDASRSLQVQRQALRDSLLREPLRQYLVDNLGDAAGLGVLAQLRATWPRSPLPRYLLGRRLYFVERFDEARMELEELPGDFSLGMETRLAAQELLLLCDLRGGNPAAVADRLAGMAAFELEPAERLRLEDYAARAAWAVGQRVAPSGRASGG